MKTITLLVLALTLVLAPAASACPLCKEAIAASDAPDEPNNLPAAFNASIYLMLGVPYLTLSVFGFLVYRGVRRNQEYLQAQAAPQPPLPVK